LRTLQAQAVAACAFDDSPPLSERRVEHGRLAIQSRLPTSGG
jgi:hypothetical protein